VQHLGASSIFALAFAGVALGAGCSASGSSGAGLATDAGADASPLDAGVDAPPPPPEQDPNVYPATHHLLPLARNVAGGPVLYAPEIVTVTFAGDAMRDELRAFDDTLVTLDWWRAVARSYAIDPGRSAGYVELPDTVSGKTLDNQADIMPLIQKLVIAGTLPTPTSQTIYVIYLPAATTVTLNGDVSCQGLGGFHDSVPVKHNAGGPTVADVAYAVLPRCTNTKDAITYAASHEIIEAATDPHPSEAGNTSYYLIDNIAWSGAGGAEVADMCTAKTRVTASGYALTRSWSNDAALASKDPCQPSDPGVYFYGAALDTETASVVDQAGSHQSDGFVTLARGATKTVYAVVFSEAALPGELSLVVGKRTSSTDPTTVAPITKGVGADLSRTTAHNGQVVALTLTAAADATPGDHPFVLRSILSATDYHSWPAIVRVQ
jgi:hypothetical protein